MFLNSLNLCVALRVRDQLLQKRHKIVPLYISVFTVLMMRRDEIPATLIPQNELALNLFDNLILICYFYSQIF
jgi:hypothetical protein